MKYHARGSWCKGALLIAAILLVSGCRALLYPATRTSASELQSLSAHPGWRLQRLEVAPGVSVVGLERAPLSPGSPWVLWFGGNGTDIGSSQAVMDKMRGDDDLGLAVFAYRGYDGSGGSPSEKALEADAARIQKYLETDRAVLPARLVIGGHSLGSGIAAWLAADLARQGTPARGLVLMSPYTSIKRVATDAIFCGGFVVRDRYDTERLVPEIPAPVLILHGEDDEDIPVWHGKALAKAFGPKARLVLLPGRSHNDLWRDAKTVEEVRSFVEKPGG